MDNRDLVSVRCFLGEVVSAFRDQWLRKPWSTGVAFVLAGLYLLACHINFYTLPDWRWLVLPGKKFVVLTGIAFALLYLGINAVRRGDYRVHWRPRLAFSFLAIAGLLFLLLGPWDFRLNGEQFPELAGNFWSQHFNYPEVDVVLKRVGLPALAYLLGFGPSTYRYLWVALYLWALWQAVALLTRSGLSFLETLSLLTATTFACQHLLGGYSEILILGLALYYLDRPTRLGEKVVLLSFALSIHEVAAVAFFLPVLLLGRKEERRDWCWILAVLLMIYAGATLALSPFTSGGYEAERIAPHGKTIWQWVSLQPLTFVLGLLVAYKLYWVAVLSAITRRKYEIAALCALVGIPLTALALDTSRLVQFGSLGLILLVPQIMKDWSARARNTLAVFNLLLPSFYAGLVVNVLPGNGVYAFCLKLISQLR